jgi:outer membrane lipoprotein carrier protein
MYRHFVTFALLLGMGSVVAGPALDRLNNYNREVKTLQANFIQTVVDANGKEMQKSSGTVILHRPGRFRWDYQQPYEQLIVGNGTKVWLYDVDLEQVTVKPQDAALGNTPALLLSDVVDIDENFITRELETSGELKWLELVPKNQQNNFERIRLAFSQRELERMEFVDAFEQVTRITFTSIQRNSSIDLELFEFTPPAGVDVIGE